MCSSSHSLQAEKLDLEICSSGTRAPNLDSVCDVCTGPKCNFVLPLKNSCFSRRGRKRRQSQSSVRHVMPCEEILRWTQPCKSVWQLHPHSKPNPNHPRQAAFQPTGEILVVLASEVPSSALYLGYILKDYMAHNYLCLLQDRKTSYPLGDFAFIPQRDFSSLFLMW